MKLFVLAAVLAALTIGALPALAAAATNGYQGGTDELLPGKVAAAQPALNAQLWGSTTLDAIANDVVGATDMHVVVEDDPNEWATFFPPDVDSSSVIGFVSLTYPPMYHTIALAPMVYPTFGAWFSSGSPAGNEYNFAIAAMDLIHESFHWRLMSGDESTVNACALKYLPYYLAKDFNVPATVTQTTTEQVPVTTTTSVPVKHVKVTKHRVKVHGKWVVRTRRSTKTVYVQKTTTTYQTQPVTTDVPNPLYQTIVADAGDFYAHQPPPYNSGTCSV